VNWLTLAEVLLIHQRIIEETGGEGGLLSLDRLESALHRPFTSFSGVELYPDLIDKVAALIHGIISAHPFVDGNKRVALVAADVCLRLNGLCIHPSEAVEDFFWSIARGEQSVETITEWLRQHVEPLPTSVESSQKKV